MLGHWTRSAVDASGTFLLASVNDEVLIGALVTVAAGAFAAYTLYRAAKNLGRANAIWSHDPVDAGSVHLEDGVVEVQGTAEPIDETLSAPYTGTSSLAYTYEKERKERNHDSDGGSRTRWRTVESGSARTPFYVTDDTGSVAVDPEGASISLDSDRVGRSGRTRRSEGRLEPGETVHVYGRKRDGTADGSAPGDDPVYIGDGDGDATFTVSDTTETRTIVRYLASGIGGVIFGLVLLAVAAAPVLAYTGNLEPILSAASSLLPLVLG